MSRFFRTFVAEMFKIRQIVILFFVSTALAVYGQDICIDDVLEDIYNQLCEEGNMPMEEWSEQLLEIAENPIDLNSTNADELGKLLFLSDEQIDAILLYQYEHRFEEVYELQLIPCLKEYEIRNLLPFVKVDRPTPNPSLRAPHEPMRFVGDPAKGRALQSKEMYFREVFAFANHEMTLRLDARNIEDYEGDPIYGKLRYRFNYQNRVQAGLTLGRGVGVGLRDMDLGGYVQLRDIGRMKTLVAGNYQANFGYGLVVGSPFRRGKIAYIQSTATTDEGLKKYGSVGDDYAYFHGVGATVKLKNADVSAFYSLREGKDEGWQHTIGLNATLRWKQLKVGLTALEMIESESEEADGKAVVGMNARWNKGKVDVWGEVAAAQGDRWGFGSIVGLRYTPIVDVNLLAIYRYYSPYYENMYANALCSKTRAWDEHGGYVGLEYNRLRNWKLMALCDVWRDGYEGIFQGEYLRDADSRMLSRLRVKRKDELDSYSLRWNMVYRVGMWRMKTQVDGNLARKDGGLTYGWSVLQDAEYRFSQVPIVLQMRAQVFDARQWDNRVYIYENDVLYAYAMPFVYGVGGRFWLNARYVINNRFSLYVRLSETVYQKLWASEHDKKGSRTDIHALLRVKL